MILPGITRSKSMALGLPLSPNGILQGFDGSIYWRDTQTLHLRRPRFMVITLSELPSSPVSKALRHGQFSHPDQTTAKPLVPRPSRLPRRLFTNPKTGKGLRVQLRNQQSPRYPLYRSHPTTAFNRSTR
ncbi:Uncharacterized protein HZ326_22721 [Fusarium oxysporum f. sp. albedinis]|nr:Uncharacterized protein HZ326_22721 [Fusarium oxysporum f. sp. albedinis]